MSDGDGKENNNNNSDKYWYSWYNGLDIVLNN